MFFAVFAVVTNRTFITTALRLAFPTQEHARASLARLYPSLAHADANPDGTYNIYGVDVFSAGKWNGDVYTTADLDDMCQADQEIGGQLNVADLKKWLRDPPGEKPMYAEGSRGMPNLELTEQQIDALVAYLKTLE